MKNLGRFDQFRSRNLLICFSPPKLKSNLGYNLNWFTYEPKFLDVVFFLRFHIGLLYLFYILLLENHYVLLGVACKDCEHMCASIKFLLVWNVFVIHDGSRYFCILPIIDLKHVFLSSDICIPLSYMLDELFRFAASHLAGFTWDGICYVRWPLLWIKSCWKLFEWVKSWCFFCIHQALLVEPTAIACAIYWKYK